MKLLIADKFPDAYIDALRNKGHTIDLNPEITGEDLPGKIPGYEALVVRSTKVNADTVQKGENLKLIVRAGSGTNTIDKQAAADRGIYVCNVPGKNAIAVAELTLGLILSIDRRIPDNVSDLRKQSWNKKEYSRAQGLFGRSLGIVGLGAIGVAVAERAYGFGMHLYGVHKPGRSAAMLSRLNEMNISFVDDLSSLAQTCDILSFHVPAAAETQHLINSELLSYMQPGSVLINTSRGDLIDEAALFEAMDNKGIRAGLDVYANEPAQGTAEFDSTLARHPNVYGTHHIGASTEQAQDAVAGGVVDVIEAYTKGNVINCVNKLT